MTEGKNDMADGYPFQSVFNFAEKFWDFRHAPNVLLVHYNDLLQNTEQEMRRVAKFLEVEVPETEWPDYIKAVSFDSMKRDLDKMVPSFNFIFKHGATGFMNKGTNHRWKEELNAADLALYEARASQLDPKLRRWLENGRMATEDVQAW